MTARAPTTSSCRRYRSPCLVMPLSFSLPPLEFCRGTRPIQAARSLPDLKAVGSGTVATIALDSTGQRRASPSTGSLSRSSGARPDAAIILQHLVIHQPELGGQQRQGGACHRRYTVVIRIA